MIKHIFLFLSAFGFLDSSFLTYQYYVKDPFNCPLLDGCEQVTGSIYSQIFGVPIALLGALFYGVIFALALYSFLKNSSRPLIIASGLSLFGFLTSIYLVYIQIYVLGAICFYCMLSALSSTLLFIFGGIYLSKLKNWKRFKLVEKYKILK